MEHLSAKITAHRLKTVLERARMMWIADVFAFIGLIATFLGLFLLELPSSEQISWAEGSLLVGSIFILAATIIPRLFLRHFLPAYHFLYALVQSFPYNFSIKAKDGVTLYQHTPPKDDEQTESIDPHKKKWTVTRHVPLLSYEGLSLDIVKDIVRLQRTVEAFEEQLATIIYLMTKMPIGFFSLDRDFKVLDYNQTVLNLLHIKTIEELGQMIGPIIASLTAHETPESTSQIFEKKLFLKDQNNQDIAFDLVLMSLASPHIQATDFKISKTKTLAFIWDKSALEKWETRQKHLEEQLRIFYERSPIGMAIITPDGHIKDANQRFLEMLGEKRESLISQSLTHFVSQDLQSQLDERLKEVIKTSDNTTLSFELNFAALRSFLGLVFMNRLEDLSGQNPQIIIQVLDITQQKNLELSLTQSRKMQSIGQLAGGIAHDFNNLLTAMIGFCDLLLQRHKPGEQTFADIMQIKQNANRGANLVRQLLAFSRQQTLQPKIVNVTDILAELSQLLKRLIGINIELKILHGRDIGQVRVDQSQLEQVIINLAVNARDAMDQGGVLTIATASRHLATPLHSPSTHDTIPVGDYVVITITDTGVGIAKDHLPRIFDPFFSTKPVGAGTGLGLSTVYGILKQTGGHITVDSTIDKGTSFTIFLPAVEADAVQPAAAPLPPKTVVDLTGTGTVLLVEDEDSVRLFTARALKNKGYTVLEARSGQEALQIMQGHEGKIDIVITDLVMPEMDGATLINTIREHNTEIKILCVSGYAEETLRERVHSYQEVMFLAKPYSLKELASCVKQVLEGTMQELEA